MLPVAKPSPAGRGLGFSDSVGFQLDMKKRGGHASYRHLLPGSLEAAVVVFISSSREAWVAPSFPPRRHQLHYVAWHSRESRQALVLDAWLLGHAPCELVLMSWP